MVQNLDFAQTFLEAAGIPAPGDMQGESLMPLLTGQDSLWTRDAVYYHYYEYPSVHMVKRHYGVVTEDFKLIHFYYDVDEWELYDRKKDPGEMNNLYNDPDYEGVIGELQAKLEELRSKYGDSTELDRKYISIYENRLAREN
jgi:arylsulfatase A-like enzyme